MLLALVNYKTVLITTPIILIMHVCVYMLASFHGPLCDQESPCYTYQLCALSNLHVTIYSRNTMQFSKVQ